MLSARTIQVHNKRRMFMNRIFKISLIAVLLAMVFTSCAPAPTATEAPAAAPTEVPAAAPTAAPAAAPTAGQRGCIRACARSG